MSNQTLPPHHFETQVEIDAPPVEVFDFLDDHRRLSAHMTEPSWQMAGSSMTIVMDTNQGRALGSRITLSGRILGLSLEVEEVVTKYDPPHSKTWETVGTPRLLVIGPMPWALYFIPFQAVLYFASLSTIGHQVKAPPTCLADCSVGHTPNGVPTAWHVMPRCTSVRYAANHDELQDQSSTEYSGTPMNTVSGTATSARLSQALGTVKSAGAQTSRSDLNSMIGTLNSSSIDSPIPPYLCRRRRPDRIHSTPANLGAVTVTTAVQALGKVQVKPYQKPLTNPVDPLSVSTLTLVASVSVMGLLGGAQTPVGPAANAAPSMDRMPQAPSNQ